MAVEMQSQHSHMYVRIDLVVGGHEHNIERAEVVNGLLSLAAHSDSDSDSDSDGTVPATATSAQSLVRRHAALPRLMPCALRPASLDTSCTVHARSLRKSIASRAARAKRGYFCSREPLVVA